MNPSLSIWLDLCRVVATVVVFIGHASALEVAPLSISGHWHRTAEDAVVAFFVISGFVIAWSTERSRAGMREYVEARASRIYSVAIPAVLVALVLDHIGMRLDSSHYAPDWQYSKLWLYLPIHWTFLGGTWIGPLDPFSMASYWSLPYEAWYYALFGCAALMHGWSRTLAVTAVLTLMGPRMWLLLPCWWLGVILHRRISSITLPAIAARLLMLSAASSYVAFVFFEGRSQLDVANNAWYSWIDTWLDRPFVRGGSVHALTDYVVALMFTAFLIGCAQARISFPSRVERYIRWLAGYTFSLYLLHFSVLVLFRAAGWHHVQWNAFAVVVTVTAAGTWFLGQVGEMRRPLYRRALRSIFDRGTALLARQRRSATSTP